jgi:hypothetical protein
VIGSRHLPLHVLRERALDALGEEWLTVTDVRLRLGLPAGRDWYRLALVLERLAADGFAELYTPAPGSSRRKYRRPRPREGGG